jgi:hypothetical protein
MEEWVEYASELYQNHLEKILFFIESEPVIAARVGMRPHVGREKEGGGDGIETALFAEDLSGEKMESGLELEEPLMAERKPSVSGRIIEESSAESIEIKGFSESRSSDLAAIGELKTDGRATMRYENKSIAEALTMDLRLVKLSGFALLEESKQAQLQTQPAYYNDLDIKSQKNSSHKNANKGNWPPGDNRKTYSKHLRDWGGYMDIPDDYYSKMSCGTRVFPQHGTLENDVEMEIMNAVKERRKISKTLIETLKYKVEHLYYGKFPALDQLPDEIIRSRQEAIETRDIMEKFWDTYIGYEDALRRAVSGETGGQGWGGLGIHLKTQNLDSDKSSDREILVGEIGDEGDEGVRLYELPLVQDMLQNPIDNQIPKVVQHLSSHNPPEVIQIGSNFLTPGKL